MLKIKLIRLGQKNQPHYRFVIQEARTKRDGKYVEKIGHYAPTQSPKLLEIDLDAYRSWLAKGAQPTPTVANLVKRFESGEPFPARKAKPSKKQLEKAAAAEADAKAAAEAPQEEAAPAEAAETAEAVETAETEAPAEAPAEETAEATPVAEEK